MITDKIFGVFNKCSELLKSKKRFLAVVFIALVTLLVGVLCVWGLFSVQHVRKIIVKGESNYTDEEIVTASCLEYGELLYSVDTEEIEGNILKNAPYVRRVSVKRRFFSRIVIKLEADSAKYYIKMSDEAKDFYILSGDLRVIDYTTTDDGLSEKGLVYLELPHIKRCNMCQFVEYGEKGKNEYVKEMLEYFNNTSFADAITDIGLSSRFDDVYIVIYGKCKIIFGGTNDIEKKLELVKRTLEEHGLDKLSVGFTKIDVSVGSNPVISHPESLD